MEYRQFGSTGREVSRLGFGGAVAGLKNYLEPFDPDDKDSYAGVVEAIGKAVELGVTFFDTAPGYGERRSERMYGDGLRGVDPASIFLATKLSGKTRDDILRSVDESLKCLKRDYVDLIQIHGSSYSPEQAEGIMAEGGVLEAMEELKRQGATRFIGFTTEDNNDGMFMLMKSGRFDSVQMCYNFINQHAYEPSRPFGSLYEAKKRGMGTLTMRTATSDTFQRWVRMVNPGNTFDYTPHLIQFVLSNPLVDVALVGMRTKEFVVRNVDIVNDMAGRIDLKRLHERYV
ncbi:MAG: aldo/keto reductase [Oscillospiraceae bacterium]|nr:aldo/keto reductase [Oscillospiraceae bacterium]